MKEEANPSKKRRRKYDRTFKAEAVALWQKSGKTAEEIAAQLGIREGQLYTWKSSSEVRAGPQTDLQAENAALRRENELLRQQLGFDGIIVTGRTGSYTWPSGAEDALGEVIWNGDRYWDSTVDFEMALDKPYPAGQTAQTGEARLSRLQRRADSVSDSE